MHARKSPQITVLAPSKPGEGFGGAEKHLEELGKLFIDLGATVNFLSRSDADGNCSTLERYLGRLLPLLRSPLAARRIPDRRLNDADILITVELMGVGIAHPRHIHLFFGSYTGFRRNALPLKTSWTSRISTAIVNSVAQKLESRTQGKMGAIANSIGLRDVLLENDIPVQQQVILPPTDLEKFGPGDKGEARDSLALPLRKKILLFAGRWEYAKGADRAQKLIESLSDQWVLVIAAPSDAQMDIPAHARIISRPNIPHERMATYYRAADFLIQPSRFEGYSLVVSEAQACGCPVVSTNVGQGPHLQRASSESIRLGVIENPDDLSNWVAALTALEDFPQETLSAAARRFAEDNVSTEVVRRSWHKLLTDKFSEYQWNQP